MDEPITKQALLSISNIISLMNTSDTLQQFLADIQRTLNSITYADNFYLALIDARKKYITFPYYQDINDDFTAETLDEIPLEQIFSTLTFYAMRQKKVCVLTDTDIHQLIERREVKVLGTIPKQWLCFPLLHKEQFMGVFVIQSYRDTEEYQGVIIDLLTAISYVLASALCAFNNHAALLEAHQQLSRHKAELEQLVSERTEKLSQTVQELQQEVELNKSLHQQLEYKAQHDALTGLYNREFLNQQIRNSAHPAGYCAFIDLDGFKAVNDQHGHHIGDLLLCHVAEVLRQCCHSDDKLIRNGGDEFILLLTAERATEAVLQLLHEVLDALAGLNHISGARICIGASIGIAQACGTSSLSELLKAADAAMYQAKNAGKHRVVLSRVQ